MDAGLEPVVITGMGLASAAGLAPEAVWKAVLGGVTVRPEQDKDGLAGARVPPYELQKLRLPKNQKFLSASSRHLMWAGLQALDAAGWSGAALAPERVGVFSAAGQAGMEPSSFFPGFDALAAQAADPDWEGLGGPAARSLDFYFPLRCLSNAGLALLAMEISARGPSNNFSQSDTAGALALESAVDSLQAGECDMAICGAFENLLGAANYLNYQQAGLLSPSAPRPFDRAAAGMLLAAAGAAIVLERRSSAEARGAPILAEIGAVATALDDAAGGAEPIGTGRAVEAVCRRALGGEQPAFAVLSGLGVPRFDLREAKAVTEALGPGVPCTAFKGATGYAGGSTAILETVLAVCALRAGLVPPVAGLEHPAEGVQLDLVALQPRVLNGTASAGALCLSHSFMGQSAAIWLRTPSGS